MVINDVYTTEDYFNAALKGLYTPQGLQDKTQPAGCRKMIDNASKEKEELEYLKLENQELNRRINYLDSSMSNIDSALSSKMNEIRLLQDVIQDKNKTISFLKKLIKKYFNQNATKGYNF